jgi:Kef-type K+ transport system membrane component KefB
MKALLLYTSLVGGPILIILVVLHIGQGMYVSEPIASTVAPEKGVNLPDLTKFLIQMIVILGMARLVGGLFGFLRQPQVMGEIVAGILLGPSLFGAFFPVFSKQVFPDASLNLLSGLSYLGLIIYMFLVGLHVDLQSLLRHRRTALITSHVSIIFPFMLAALAALYLYPKLSGASVPFSHFTLFLGTGMSVTAFPVLARILADCKFLPAKIGTIALVCAAVDDVTSWCILSGLVLLIRAGGMPVGFWMMIFGALAYTVAILVFGWRLFRRVELAYRSQQSLTNGLFSLVIMAVLISACITESLGIHALFGGFLIGVVMPKNDDFIRALSEKIEGFVVPLLLPLFFAFTGLRADIGLLSDSSQWFYCCVLIATAILGKLGGSTLSTRLCGMPWRESFAVGTLMNTRGLMELVVLNVGLDVGVINQTVFTMMIMMALVTTFMTTPILEWMYPAQARGQACVATMVVSVAEND